MEFKVWELLGIPFVWGGRDPATGLDCYGLVKEWYRRVKGIELEDVEDYDREILKGDPFACCQTPGAWVEVTGAFETGDVLVFGSGNGQDATVHCGVLLARGKVLHTAEGHGSIVSPLRLLKSRLLRGYRRA
jgi:cell wall-associated NlpC family hydrolase